MEKRKLGNTGIDVSVICLGTMTWGEQNTEAEAHSQLDHALERGVNFIDTAELYPVPPMEETRGRTESIIGTWLKRTGRRDRVVLASKVSGPGEWVNYIRGGPRLDRTQMTDALDDSLRRLNTDYLDLYQVHWPARPTNFFGNLGYTHEEDPDATPIEETLEALDEFVRQGKVRHVGVSNETPWGVMEYLRLARERDWPRMVSIQNPYNLLNRSFEVGLAEMAIREHVGLMAYSPMGFGVLSGKYLDSTPANARITLFPRFARYSNAHGVEATRAYVELARAHGLSPAQMALAFVNSRPFLTSTIIGATSMAQLEEDIESAELVLGDEVLEAIETIHTRHPNPCP
ncbi:NADP(H)-dependent aldo-keto reductase [Thioalkalivibrio thiocyanodenitrificans]|uniref:NADP(H)-dependent aldo-keto reductase n=1 Tax=Thioalkalivibrio thiocyanodenitrificans TaxID=243063 RepID=UPI0003623EE1|nr:NADP(H)-dependent aldo-keto reductase [Thioalkalivibrio thiocyanodenitrificans]